MVKAIPQGDEYARYADAHWRELIERYRPAVLWNDIGYPTAGDSPRLFADYYNAYPDGVVNNRFDFLGVSGGTAHADFTTPEYATMAEITAEKWESCRGIGHSFGLNRNEPDAALLTVDGLVHMLVDIVEQERQPAAERRTGRGRTHSARPSRAAARPRLVAASERRGDLRHLALDESGGVHCRGAGRPLHAREPTRPTRSRSAARRDAHSPSKA